MNPTSSRPGSPQPDASARTASGELGAPSRAPRAPGGSRRRALRQLLLTGLIVAVGAWVLFRWKLGPVPVEVHSVEHRAMTSEVMGTGTLEARVKATISPKIQGRLAAVLVDQNDTIAEGQLLARLDDGEWKQQVEIADAALAAARATVERVRTDEARAEAVEKQARLDHQRAGDLRTSNIAAQSELDKATEYLNVARADVRRSRAAVQEAEKQGITAEKTLAFHRERLADTRLISPLAGLVVRRLREGGDIAVPGQQQRVAVARALANQPGLILADEPTAALDSHRGRQVMELFRQVAQEQGAAVIVVTHDHRALDVFDRTFEMEDGRLRPSA